MNRELWQSYDGARWAGDVAPLAFVIRAPTEGDATVLMERFRSRGCQIAWIKRKWWPSRRRWEIAAKNAESIALTFEAIDRWALDLQAELEPYGALLTHWVPAGA